MYIRTYVRILPQKICDTYSSAVASINKVIQACQNLTTMTTVSIRRNESRPKMGPTVIRTVTPVSDSASKISSSFTLYNKTA